MTGSRIQEDSKTTPSFPTHSGWFKNTKNKRIVKVRHINTDLSLFMSFSNVILKAHLYETANPPKSVVVTINFNKVLLEQAWLCEILFCSQIPIARHHLFQTATILLFYRTFCKSESMNARKITQLKSCKKSSLKSSLCNN